jgi:hypothetical protein
MCEVVEDVPAPLKNSYVVISPFKREMTKERGIQRTKTQTTNLQLTNHKFPLLTKEAEPSKLSP